jgi:hypothetical protein
VHMRRHRHCKSSQRRSPRTSAAAPARTHSRSGHCHHGIPIITRPQRPRDSHSHHREASARAEHRAQCTHRRRSRTIAAPLATHEHRSTRAKAHIAASP